MYNKYKVYSAARRREFMVVNKDPGWQYADSFSNPCPQECKKVIQTTSQK